MPSVMMADYVLQGGVVIRATRRTIERVGFDPDTGLLLSEAPNLPEINLLEDSK